MKTINKPSDNLGGLTKIWAIPYDVYSLNGDTVSISDETNVYEIYCTPESMEFNEPKEKTDAGVHYNTEINGFTPGITSANRDAMEYMENRKWVIILRDGNGNYLAAGSNIYGLEAFPDLSSGKDTTGRSGYSFSFRGKTTSRAKFVINPF